MNPSAQESKASATNIISGEVAVGDMLRAEQSWRDWAYWLLDAEASWFGAAYVLTDVILVLMDLYLIILSSLHSRSLDREFWETFQYFIGCFQIADILVRFLISSNRFGILRKLWIFIRNPHNVIGLLAILPFASYATGLIGVGEVLVNSDSQYATLQVFWMLRVLLRPMRLVRHFPRAQLMFEALGGSLPALTVPLYILVVLVISFGSLVYYYELSDPAGLYTSKRRPVTTAAPLVAVVPQSSSTAPPGNPTTPPTGTPSSNPTSTGTQSANPTSAPTSSSSAPTGTPPNNPSSQPTTTAPSDGTAPLSLTGFTTIFYGFWFALVTIATVGYGDIYPGSWQGKVVTCVFILTCNLYMAIPISVIGNNFMAMWSARNELVATAKLKRKIEETGIKSEVVRTAFFGLQSNGQLFFPQFNFVIKCLSIGLTTKGTIALFKLMDETGRGRVSFRQFAKIAFPDETVADIGGPVAQRASVFKGKDVDIRISQELHDQIVSSVQNALGGSTDRVIKLLRKKGLLTTALRAQLDILGAHSSSGSDAGGNNF